MTIQKTRKTRGWKPLVYVIEIGTKGYLHIHFINEGFLLHSPLPGLMDKSVIEHWRELTGEDGNVHFKGKRSDPKKAFYYLAKYIGKQMKEYRTYSYLGRLYKTKMKKSDPFRCKIKKLNKSICDRGIWLWAETPDFIDIKYTSEQGLNNENFYT